MTEQEIIELLKNGEPFKGLAGVKVMGVEYEPWQTIPDKDARPDVAMSIEFSGTKVNLYGEIKTQITPRILGLTSSLLVRLNLNNLNRPYILICPFLSQESQKYCQGNNIGFIDMCGNIFINIPGTVLIQRLGQPNIFKEPRLLRNPFSGVSSRVVRVLLQLPNRIWSITDIYQELIEESFKQGRDKYFQISLSSVSKTIDSLEESLLVRRDGMKILVPEPKQLLFQWAEKYQQRYNWMRRSSWICNNPFGFDLKESLNGLKAQFSNAEFVVTGSAAASLTAPFVNIDRIDVYIMNSNAYDELRKFATTVEKGKGPDFLFFIPYDEGVAMYVQRIDTINTASNIQAYLDCYARGGRDAKQAEYLLTNIIEKEWAKKND